MDPELGFRSCLGILRLAKTHGADRLEAACARGLSCGARSYKSIKSILDKRLDMIPVPEDIPPTPPMHDNVRGAAYYS